MSKFYLDNDGTLDTVVTCEDCGEQIRFNYGGDPAWRDLDYDNFVHECLDTAEDSHDCEEAQ